MRSLTPRLQPADEGHASNRSKDPLTTVTFNRASAEHAEGLKTYAARMLGDQMLAEDIAQDAFLALYRHLHEGPRRRVPGPGSTA
jgi:DNA-directed RNA polymerase specialized sigma24 family protein